MGRYSLEECDYDFQIVQLAAENAIREKDVSKKNAKLKEIAERMKQARYWITVGKEAKAHRRAKEAAKAAAKLNNAKPVKAMKSMKRETRNESECNSALYRALRDLKSMKPSNN